MNRGELIQRYKAGERNFSGADLRGANLRGVNLSGADLRDADLRGAILSGADLSGAYLSGANLYGAYLSGADLSGAKIADDKIIGGYFTETRIGRDSGELQVAFNATDIWLKRGCSGWLTPEQFLQRVNETHGDTPHGRIYRGAVEYIVNCRVPNERELIAGQEATK